MKLRQKPDDFIVEEIPSKEWKKSGKYAVYSVSKVGMTTFAAEKVLATHCNVSFRKIGFAGLKDAHARTAQYFSIETDKPDCGNFKEQHVNSELVGFLDEQLRTGDLKGNKFIITVRDLKKFKLDKEQVEQGVPNYFDSQRFGSLKGVKGFIAKDVLKGDYESAVKKIITATTRHQKAKIRATRRFISSNWGNWPACLDQVEKAGLQRTVEGNVVSHLSEFPTDFKSAFKKTFKGIREIFFSAYQSYIWNECIKRVVRQNSKEVFSVEYEAGKLVFPRKWNPDSKLAAFPSISPEIKTSEENMKIINEVLKQEGMQLSDFSTDEHIFVQREREVLLKSESLVVSEPEADDLNEHKKKVTVSFSLPKGSYATIILKVLFEE
ncbi:MAG TPA: tRNA pseudouridine(13) synthase TruD [Candidatus Nanoarchaeia archaeon]|nr:tRNA pseudouridine(13) synthase TruD [Candidatus Nanoarchaeia archaeon]